MEDETNTQQNNENNQISEPLIDSDSTKVHSPSKLRNVKNGKRFILALIAFTAITVLNWCVPMYQWPWKFLLRDEIQPQELSLPAQLEEFYNLRAASMTLDNRPVMSTFFTPVEGGCCGMTEDGHLNLVKAWEEAWQSWGWDTRVLTEEDARDHPRFEEMEERLSKSDVNGYNHRCFWRWLAMANDPNPNGGWMSDYDAFPLLLTGEVGWELMSVEGFQSWNGHVPSLIHADQRSWETMVDYMIKVISPSLKVEKMTDMYVLLYLYSNFPASELNIKTWEELTYEGAYVYRHTAEGSDEIEVDCDGANLALISHLSHHDTKEAVRKGLYPKLEGMRDGDLDVGVERRAEAAAIMMKDYRDACFF